MRNASIALLVSIAALAACSRGPVPWPTSRHSGAASSYAVIGSIAGPAGSYDYASFDEATRQLFVGRSYGVMRVDPATGTAKTLLARAGVAAVLPIAGTRLMLSTNGDNGTATLFDRDTGTVAADLPTGKEPDGAWYDPASGRAFVMNGASEDVTMIDVAARKVVATIKIPGKPEAATSDGKGHLFVNIEDRNAIAVINIARRRVTGRYPLAGCTQPTAIAFDPTTGLLMSACHNGIVRLIDAASGGNKGQVTIGGVPTACCSIPPAAPASPPASTAR